MAQFISNLLGGGPAPDEKPVRKFKKPDTTCYKVLLTGNIGVGKSNILQRYYRGIYTAQVPTIGVEFQTKTL